MALQRDSHKKDLDLFNRSDPEPYLKLTISSYQENQKSLSNLAKSKHLKEVHISGEISDEEVGLLCKEVLLGADLLERLTLELSDCSDNGVVHIRDLIEQSRSIKHLSLLLNNVGEEGAKVLSRGLSGSSLESFSIYATQLDLHDRSVGDIGVCHIASAVKSHSSLRSLCVAQNGVSRVGLASLLNSLKCNNLLTELDLCYNQIDSKGAGLMGTYLRDNVTLKRLILNGNRDIKCEGAREIAISLCQNSTLKYLGLRSCGVAKKGAERFAMTLSRNSTLETLDLCGNTEVKDDAVELISRGLKENKSLTELNLSSCGIGDEGCAHLADALLTNKTLTHLLLQKNEIGDGGMLSLSETLKYNSVLSFLSVAENRLSHKASTALIQSLSYNSILTTLLIDRSSENKHEGDHGNIKSMVDILLDKNRQLSHYKMLTKKLLKRNEELTLERDTLLRKQTA